MALRFTWFFSLASVFLATLIPFTGARAADRYEIDPAHTHVQFSVLRFGFNDVIGSFTDVKGTITLDKDAPEKSAVEVVISVASLVSGDATRDQHLSSEFWFNSENFPEMTFQSTAVEVIDETSARVTGDLTLLGVSKPVTLMVTLNKAGQDPASKSQAVGFSVTGSLDRTAFGMNTAAGLVGTDVAIRIETLAHKAE